MTHVQILPYPGWVACQMDRDFATWLLSRHPRLDVTAPAVCPACRAIVEAA